MSRDVMKALWFFAFLLVAGVAHAQQPGVDCAPVQGQGWSGCAPINPSQPSYQGQQSQIPPPPPQRWADRWGAIATDFSHGSVGMVDNSLSQSSAQQAATTDCQAKGGLTCKIEIAYRNECAALVAGDKGHVTRAGATVDAAIQAGLEKCRGEDTNCKAYFTGCSIPVRIQ